MAIHKPGNWYWEMAGGRNRKWTEYDEFNERVKQAKDEAEKVLPDIFPILAFSANICAEDQSRQGQG